jgi:hypothetical protein
MTERATGFAEATWSVLEHDAGGSTATFDPSTLDALPEPARRFLRAAIPAGAPLATGVVLEMAGEIRLMKRWFPFTARQILRAHVGFVWQPVVGGRLLRFVGADILGPAGSAWSSGSTGASRSSGQTARTSSAAPPVGSPPRPSSGCRRA